MAEGETRRYLPSLLEAIGRLHSQLDAAQEIVLDQVVPVLPRDVGAIVAGYACDGFFVSEIPRAAPSVVVAARDGHWWCVTCGELDGESVRVEATHFDHVVSTQGRYVRDCQEESNRDLLVVIECLAETRMVSVSRRGALTHLWTWRVDGYEQSRLVYLSGSHFIELDSETHEARVLSLANQAVCASWIIPRAVQDCTPVCCRPCWTVQPRIRPYDFLYREVLATEDPEVVYMLVG